ncbi:glycoside hydrolase family 3 N-terminal domain-containing protein [Consotaella salsifontis]|uniref:beta-glucosidase n=1 Tax=Consotaella salsifontis TaxID=1365950 RepID=A0A1T4LGW0_9HYPH|nr:glycoside hydrolase family 3 N-terminal domain-containing protein [Consotaella salsifontis]SJZ54022.1 beta-glucosidase [Consotaella salsifontis]
MNRVNALLSAMTIEEKIGQLTMVTAGWAVTGPVLAGDPREGVRAGRIGSLLNLWGRDVVDDIQRLAVEESRMGIPLLLGFDVVHGHRTVFPIPLGEAAAFDPDLWEKTAAAAAAEAGADGLTMTFAPMIDVARDPRWGRIAEGPGEDPLVASRMAVAKVQGFQGKSLASVDRVAATAKHFCAYGAATAGRDYASVDIAERTLAEVYLPPFEAAVRAGAAAIMPSFNDIAGVPMTVHVPLLREWLRDRTGFDGVLVSDYTAIPELLKHGVAADLVEAAALALKAGVDIDMMGFAYEKGLVPALERGLIEEKHINESVLRVLVLKERLGLLDDPYRHGTPRSSGQPIPDRTALAREAARRSMVLLKNDGGTLPLSSGLASIAVVGPLAEARGDMRGPWSAAGRDTDPVTIVEGLRAALPGCRISTAPGVAVDDPDTKGIAAAVELCSRAEAVVLCLGETATMSGEAASRADPCIPGRQRELAEAILGTGRPVVVLLSSGRPLVAPWLFERADCVVATWFLGTEAGHAIADVITGKAEPTGRLPVTWPRAEGQIPIFYGQRPSGRPSNPADHYTSKYLDVPVEPQFAFGHGCSYGRIDVAAVRASPSHLRADGRISVEVDLTNDGERASETTVFVFIRDPVASIARPVLELKDFKRAALDIGQRLTLRFELKADDLAFLGHDLAPCLEPGVFEIAVGQSADPVHLTRTTVCLDG